MLRHSFTYLQPKLLLPSNPCRRTASSMEGCTGTSHRVPGMPLPPAPTAAQVTAKGLPRRAGEFKRDPCPCPTAGDRGCVQHAQAQGGVRATGQRPGPVALPQMPPVMAPWERVGSPDQPAHCPFHLPGHQGQVGTGAGCPEALEPGNRHSRAPGLHPAGAATVRMHLPTFLGAACMLAEELSGVRQGSGCWSPRTDAHQFSQLGKAPQLLGQQPLPGPHLQHSQLHPRGTRAPNPGTGGAVHPPVSP